MIKGLIAPILSPFNDDLSFNQDMYNALAAELLQTGCSGLAPFGTTGEALSIGSAERTKGSPSRKNGRHGLSLFVLHHVCL